MKLRNQKKKLNKKGISVIIGYVLLIAFAIIISAGVYSWLKTYVPREPLDCPDGVSVFIKGADFDASTRNLSITVRNNGRFDIAGYFLYATNTSEQKTPSIDLSKYLNESQDGIKFGNAVLLSLTGSNDLKPGDERTNMFNISVETGNLYLIKVLPTRFQEENNKKRFVSCANANVQQVIGETTVCTPATDPTQTGVCGTRECDTALNGTCGSVNCGTCEESFFCDASGQCISTACTPATDPTQTGVCGTFECGTATNGTCGEVNCGVNEGLCIAGSTCSAEQMCVVTCGDGDLDTGETCDGGTGCLADCTCPSGYITDGSLGCTTIGNDVCDVGETCSQDPVACEGQQAQCAIGETCQSGVCVFNADGSFNSCGDYCALFGFSEVFACQDNPNKCAPPQGPVGGTYIGNVDGADETYGNDFCIGNPYCCCIP